MIYDQFPDANGNDVLVRPSANADGRIEVSCHAPSPPYLYNKEECYPMLLDMEQAERLVAAVTKGSKEATTAFLRLCRAEREQQP